MTIEEVRKGKRDPADPPEMPTGWTQTTIGEIFSLEYGKSLTKSARTEGGKYPVYGSSGKVGFHDDFLVTGPALIIGRKGAAGAVHLCNENFWPIDTTYFIKPSTHLSTVFSFYLLKFCRLHKYESSTAIPGLNRDHAYAEPLLLPPFAEQLRIVAKIEELVSELDKAEESLDTALRQLKVYRQAILKQAFEGKLTSDWRAHNSDKVESTEALLARIQQCREALYQEQLLAREKSQETGGGTSITGRKSAKPKAPKYLPPLTSEELLELGTLPESWKWIQVGEAFGVYVGSTPSRANLNYWGNEIPWVSSGEVAFCRIKGTKEKITEAGYLNASTEIHPSGTVMLAMIGEGKTRGQAAILDVPAAHNQNTAAIRVSEAGCIPEFMYFYLCFQYEITRKIGSGNNQKALNKERVSTMRMPLCSVSEQRVLVQFLEEKFSAVDQLEKTIIDSQLQARALRQSILKKAFSGKLVHQNCEDEPASVLLERIRSERVIKPTKTRSVRAKASG